MSTTTQTRTRDELEDDVRYWEEEVDWLRARRARTPAVARHDGSREITRDLIYAEEQAFWALYELCEQLEREGQGR